MRIVLPRLLGGVRSGIHACTGLAKAIRPGSPNASLRSALPLLFLTAASLNLQGVVVESEPEPERAPWRVVILHGANFFLPAALEQDQAMRQTLLAESNRRIEFYPEAMETFRLPSSEYEPEYVAFLQKKYAAIPVDLILAVSLYALEFAERHRDALWPGLPVVFYSVSEELVRDRALKPGFTGQSIAFDVAGTVDLALRLQPNATRVIVVGGVADADQYWVQRAAQRLLQSDRSLDTLYWTNRSAAQLIRDVRTLGREDVVLFSSIYRDITGQTFVPIEVMKSLAEASGAPVYHWFGTNSLGDGTVGGSLISFHEQGVRAARVGRRVLEGEKPETIPVQPPPPPVVTVDWRQLKRWGLDERRLPDGAVAVLRPPTLWSEHKRLVLGAVAIVAFQATTIAALLGINARRRRTESEWRESERRFRTLADSAPIMIWMADADQRCIYFNQRWLDFTGRPHEAEVGDGWIASVHPEDVGRRVAGFREAFAARQRFTVEYRLRRHDGRYRWILAQAVPRFSQAGEFLGYVGSCLDISDRKQREETDRNLAHVARVSTMGQLASALAHELNQPLGAILRNAEAGELILQQSQPDHDEIRAILADIRLDDQRAGAVIDRMRSLLQRRNLTFDSLSVKHLVEQLTELLRVEMLNRRVRLRVEIPPDLPSVRGDRVHLQQVLLNLLVNGADAMADVPADERNLVVRGRCADAHSVEVSVIDSGHGIPDAKLPHLFEPFFTTKPAGMGMGLAISKTIVEAHHGRIWAENNAAGGATIRVVLRTSPSGVGAAP